MKILSPSRSNYCRLYAEIPSSYKNIPLVSRKLISTSGETLNSQGAKTPILWCIPDDIPSFPFLHL